MHPSFIGPLAYAWLTSATLRQAMTRVSRYSHLVNNEVPVNLRDSGDEVLITYDFSKLESLNPALRERCRLAMCVQACRRSRGEDFSPSRVSMRQKASECSDLYREFFACEVAFNSPEV